MIERVEAQIDGTEWKPLKELDLPLIDTATDETSIQSYFAGKKSQYDLYR